ncbi:MAG: winged helix-turn-helix transcriptional regulator [Muribaculaceae bacterium]|nr:winged helix-turn-helix transcriptional regulator [Muribaculaceae bacterium]
MKTLPKTHHASIARLIDGNRTRAAIIRTIIKHNGYISISEIAKQLQLARSTVIRHIYVLKYLRLIQHEGKVRGGRWRVINCSRWDINEYMGIPLKLSCHLNRFATTDDLDWDEPDESSMKPNGCGTKNNEPRRARGDFKV